MHMIFFLLFSALSIAADLQSMCADQMASLKGLKPDGDYKKLCAQAKTVDPCQSENGSPIYFFDYISQEKNAKRILALSLIHGDEEQSGTVTRAWISRLANISPRNSWRVIPIANPDGFKKKTRTNSNKVDINRNFPTDDWEKTALSIWRTKLHSDPRRFPGPTSASEKETKCLMHQFEDFKPDFIISVHTPLGLLDFDGPKVGSPDFNPLPWISLGNYPGSIGRYMWRDKKIPVLTIELKGNTGVQRLEHFDMLQDIAGTVAIQAHRLLESGRKKD